jgi:hypothetical protein
MIIKAKFTRRKSEAKHLLRYITHRPGREKENLTRTLFGYEGELTKEEAYELIDSQKGMTYFHVILNFDQKREDNRRDLDLRDITRQTMAALEERLDRTIRFFAVEHNDHTELRHIHAIAILKLARGERVVKEDWQEVRKAGMEYIRVQRRALEVVRDYQRGLQQHQAYRQRRVAERAPRHVQQSKALEIAPVLRHGHVPGRAGERAHHMRAPHGGGLAPSARHLSCTCPRCHLSQTHDRHQGSHRCSSCGFLLHKQKELSLQRQRSRGKGLELELSL